MNNGNCVCVKGFASMSNGNCVTVELGKGDGVELWDSKNPDAGSWNLTLPEWKVFLDACEHGVLALRVLDDEELVRIHLGDEDEARVIAVEADEDLTYTWRMTGEKIVHVFTRDEMGAFWMGCMFRQFSDGWTSDGEVSMWAQPDELAEVK